MSRIPKIGSTSSSDAKKENEIAFKKPASGSALENNAKYRGVKRPSGDQISISIAEKKFKSAVGNLTTATKRSTLNVIPSTHTRSKAAFTSANANRAVLQPIQDNGTVRGSMPAIALSSLKGNVPFKSRRPAWDLKGRMQDMEEHFSKTQETNSNLMKDLHAYNERIAALEAANSMLHQDFEIKSVQSQEASSQVQKLQNELRAKSEEFDTLMIEKESENSKFRKAIQQLNEKLEASKKDFEDLQHTYQQETAALKSSITQLTCLKSGLQAQLDATELLLEEERSEVKTLKIVCSDKEKHIQLLLQKNSGLEEKLREEETLRRKLHNAVQELKGNIRVYCRMRPPLPDELQRGINVANITVIGDKMIEINQLTGVSLNESGGKAQPKYEFSFDHVFPPTASQKEVFHEISQLVQSSLDGYNVCIFAYGQTGSGKTYTMEGPENLIDFSTSQNNHGLGMIPRSIQQIFKTVEDLKPKGWKYKIEALFLEIYNERIQDLLNSQNGNAKCEIIKSGAKGSDCILSNVTASEVTSVEQVFNLLHKARINRAVAATKCNEYSSRSHYVFQMKIFGSNEITGQKCEGILNLVDLAGSERVKDSGSSGERLTEAKAINKSLSNLGNVIMALSRKENHIPYRDSKLTHLLANSLGGNSKTLMFVNISPDQENLNETVNSLRFATKVNQCNIGTAQKKVK